MHAESRLRDRHDENAKMIENILKTAIGKKKRKYGKNEHSRRSHYRGARITLLKSQGQAGIQ